MIRYVCPKCGQWVEVLAATVPPTCNNTAAHARAQTMARELDTVPSFADQGWRRK